MDLKAEEQKINDEIAVLKIEYSRISEKADDWKFKRMEAGKKLSQLIGRHKLLRELIGEENDRGSA